jgi:hypothetical protein
MLAQMTTGAPQVGEAICRHLAVRVSVLAGDRDKGVSSLDGSLPVAMAVEDVHVLRELMFVAPDRRHACEDCLAEMLPISLWRRGSDLRRSDLSFFMDGFPEKVQYEQETPLIPLHDSRKMLEIAGCLQRCGFHELARRAYAEAVYSTFAPAWIMEPCQGSWLSPEAAELWAEAAQCARLAGRQELAWYYLMKAAVFGSDALFEQTRVTAEQWSNEPKPAAPPAVDPVVKREALTRVVRLYAELNAHPRALLLIDENRDALDDPDALRKEIVEQWLPVVREASAFATRVTLYGYEVYPGGDPLKVRIPWALSDDALDSVRERLAAIRATAEPPNAAPLAAPELQPSGE